MYSIAPPLTTYIYKVTTAFGLHSLYQIVRVNVTSINKMAPKLYMVPGSPPVRSVLLTAKAIGLELELITVDLTKGEHLAPEYLKLNPQHTVPTLDDNGFVIWDSHAINIYLLTKYGKSEDLYPSDAQQRAIINQRLHFDSGVIFPQLITVVVGIIREGAKEVTQSQAEKVREAYGFLEKFLEGRQWAAGNNITLADLSLIPSITSAIFLVPLNNKFPNIAAWLKRAEALPYYDANKVGLLAFQGLIKSFLG